MVTQGARILDHPRGSRQIDWMVVPIEQCPDDAAERRVVASHFRIPHEPWAPCLAFVRPVVIRRSRRRVFFAQESGRAI